MVKEGGYVDGCGLRYVSVLGVGRRPEWVEVGGRKLEGGWLYDEVKGVLRVEGLEGMFEGGVWKGSWGLRWE